MTKKQLEANVVELELELDYSKTVCMILTKKLDSALCAGSIMHKILKKHNILLEKAKESI